MVVGFCVTPTKLRASDQFLDTKPLICQIFTMITPSEHADAADWILYFLNTSVLNVKPLRTLRLCMT